MTKSLPVLLYHYLNRTQGSIAVAPETFDAHCKAMSKAGYRGIGLEEAAGYLLHGERLPSKSVLITFDDGYLDNYVYGLPALNKYGHKATVFVVAERIEEQGLRPTLCEEQKGHGHVPEGVNAPYEVDALGHEQRKDMFMSWDEARVAEAANILDIASHSLSHAPVWSAPPLAKWRGRPNTMELVHPCPHHRTFDKPKHPVPFGMPLLPEEPGLTNQAFLPSKELLDLLRDSVPQDLENSCEFFKDEAKIRDLRKVLLDLPLKRWGRTEELDEYRRRVRHELTASRVLLERHLANNTRRPLTRACLAWPWGAYTPTTLEIAKDVGFQIFFATTFGPNLAGQSASHVHRFKARDKSPGWLLSRLRIYSSSFLAKAYAAMRI